MSAATRTPYLGEDVHYSYLDECLAAKVTSASREGNPRLWVFFYREPVYVDHVRYNAARGSGTWHYQH